MMFNNEYDIVYEEIFISFSTCFWVLNANYGAGATWK